VASGAGTEHPREMFLNWDRVLDDKGHLRRCPVCGCEEFYRCKGFPRLAALGALVFAGVLATALLGLRAVIAGVIVLAVVLALDLLIVVFARWRLVCYGCRTEFSDVPMNVTPARWDSGIAEKHRLRQPIRRDDAASSPASERS
jgi:hypothetical protein